MRFNLRYTFHLFSAFIKKFGVIILLSILIGFGIFALIAFILPRFINHSTQRIGIAGRYQPDTLPYEVVEKISSGLTKVNQNQEVEPNVAKSWETSDNGKTWIFQIRDDIVWQDGKKLTSGDVNYSFSGVNIEYPDDHTIKFILEDKYAPFPTVVSKPLFRRGLLGLGAWTVKKANITSGYIKQLDLIDNKGNKIIYKFYPTEDRTKLALKLGQIDTIQNIYNQSPFDKWNTIKVSTDYKESLIVTLFFNYRDNLLSDKSLRQALTYAINKDKFGQRALSPIPESSWAYNPQVKEYEYNPDRAKEIIDSLSNEVKQKLEIKLITTPMLLDTAESIVDDWKDIGINSSVLVSSEIPDDFQAFLAIFEAPNDPDQYTIWHSKQIEAGTNISKYQNIRIDKLLEDGRVELNFDERRKIYLDFQRFLLEDLPAAFLYHPPVYTIERK